MLPTFICIGAQKSATTWLYTCLKRHPQVFLPEIKELNFFYRDLAPGWYKQQFKNANLTQVRGDISPNYMVLPGVAERMHAVVPQASLLCMLREPFSRARSQYRMAVQLGNIPADTSFLDAFKQNLQFIRERGQYLDLLRRFTSHYPLGKQLKICLYDDVVANPGLLLNEVCAYIGVGPVPIAGDLRERVDAADGETAVEAETEHEIRRFYAPHIDNLENYLQRPLQSWRSLL